MELTSTSPAPASEAIRDATCTAIPRGFSPEPALHLARVDAGPDVEPERPEGVPDLDGTADRAGRPVERGQEAVPGGVELLPGEASERTADRRVVLVEQGSPARVPEILDPLGRADEIGEEDGGQHAVGGGTGRVPVRNSSTSSTIWSASTATK